MTEFNQYTPERSPKKLGLLRRLAARGLKEATAPSPETPPVELTPDGVPKSVQSITTIDPTGEEPAVTRTYKNW